VLLDPLPKKIHNNIIGMTARIGILTVEELSRESHRSIVPLRPHFGFPMRTTRKNIPLAV
jgi:hypothetical protein